MSLFIDSSWFLISQFHRKSSSRTSLRECHEVRGTSGESK